ncbi:methyltransferase domain-containing protein [Duganella sp. FT109W]|uniref:Methyltransferase domain-containing protein n=1 Tax=Duganella margarita TaxID=2692170 RepID=A0ABW9WPH4_9BURK|nr:methyltransferase domain-containing protein [Duganella margarita]MYN43137.1 methyltransferase domain-containing protein [Duganella margarita]
MTTMPVDRIPIISVSYNSAELIDELLASVRAHYANPITIIDGSDSDHYRAIEAVCARYADVAFIHFDYNIHHGPGMAWAFQNLDLHGPVLVLDSDVVVLNGGFIESMLTQLRPGMYGVGYTNYVNEGGFDVDYVDGAVRYLHPACMLINIEVVRQWPMPTRHGAPMTAPMLALHRAGMERLIDGVAWLKEDFKVDGVNHYLRHDWQGTVKRVGSYHLDDWEQAAREAASLRLHIQTLLPARLERVVEIGASDGALARAVKGRHPHCDYTAIGIDPHQRDQRKGACNHVLNEDVDALGDDFFRPYAGVDCWVLDQVLERVAHPERLLQRLRKVMAAGSSIVAVVPNAQHWSLQTRLCAGDLRYAETGLLAAGQRRLFSRSTLFALFQQSGFAVAQGLQMLDHPLQNEAVMAALRQLALSVGADPDLAITDAHPTAYILQAIPN